MQVAAQHAKPYENSHADIPGPVVTPIVEDPDGPEDIGVDAVHGGRSSRRLAFVFRNGDRRATAYGLLQDAVLTGTTQIRLEYMHQIVTIEGANLHTLATQIERETRVRVREIDPAQVPDIMPKDKSYVTSIKVKVHQEEQKS